MAVLPVIGPRIAGVPGIDSANIKSYSPAQSAAFREAGFIQLITTGTATGKVVQVSSGALLNVAGPVFAAPISINSTAAVTNGNITITGVVSASAPAAQYYVFATYTATGIIESVPGPEFIVSCAAGFMFSVNVASASAPAGATNFAVYVATYEGGELLQQATKTTTALGAAFSVPFPLTNSVGVNQAPTNATTNVAGIALQDSQSVWAVGVGGGFTVGNIQSTFGGWMPGPNLGPIDPSQLLAASLTNGQIFEVCLLTPWSNALIGSQVSLTLDTSGWHGVSVTGANPFAVITGKAFGSPADVGGVSDTNVRVNCIALASAVI